MEELFWQSTDKLGTAISRLNWIMAICGVVIAVASILSLFFGSRKENLEKSQEEVERNARLKEREQVQLIEAKGKPRVLDVWVQGAKGGEVAVRESVRETLMPYKGTLLNISAASGNQEAMNFGIQVGALLQKCGWVVNGVNSLTIGGEVIEGISLNLRTAKLPEAMAALVDLLGANGHQVKLKIDPRIKEGYVELVIGVKSL